MVPARPLTRSTPESRAKPAEPPPVWYLMGPTAAGKTEMAIELCRRFPFEIISADSSMVYRGLNIGTAKPPNRVLEQVAHHLIDIRDPHEGYSAAEFTRDAHALILDIIERGRQPLLVGGTMFYLRALEFGLPAAPGANPGLRRRLERRGEREGWPALHRELARLDPGRAERVRPTDRQRIQRALEIVMLTGKSSAATPFGVQGAGGRRPRPLCKLVLAPTDRKWLHARIERRYGAMLEAGLVEETRRLLSQTSLSPELPALRMVGYRQAGQFLRGEVGYNEMARRGIAATRQLAKRQLTWLRNQSGVVWIDCTSRDALATTAAYVASKMATLGI